MPARRPQILAQLVLALLVCLAACSGPPNEAETPPALLDVWVGLDDAAEMLAERPRNPCESAFGTWFTDFVVRGLSCVAANTIDPGIWVRWVAGAFESGPHFADGESFRLDLSSERDFGHYNEAFVDWVIENGIVGEERPVMRALTQPIYNTHIRRLARIYWLTHEDIEADGFPASTPAGILSGYASFLEGAPIPDGADSYEGGFSVYAFTDLSEGLLPRIGLRLTNEWEAKYEANTAFGFWLRRRVDGTHERWRDGLGRLLETYDEEWVARTGI